MYNKADLKQVHECGNFFAISASIVHQQVGVLDVSKNVKKKLTYVYETYNITMLLIVL